MCMYWYIHVHVHLHVHVQTTAAYIITFIGNHTFAVIRGAENYDLIEAGLKPVLKEINELIENKIIEVNGDIHELSIVLGGDYKVTSEHTITSIT